MLLTLMFLLLSIVVVAANADHHVVQRYVNVYQYLPAKNTWWGQQK
jgi:hypothetical protein